MLQCLCGVYILNTSTYSIQTAIKEFHKLHKPKINKLKAWIFNVQKSQKQNLISLLAQAFASQPNMAFSCVRENV